MAAGGGDINITMKRLDGDKEEIRLKLSKRTTVAAIRARVEMEFGIPPDEQLLLFRGRQMLKDSFQPLSVPDLQEIIAESGEKGLQMAVAYQKRRVREFFARNKLEDENSKLPTEATALHRATRRCEFNVMEELLAIDEFTGINARDRSGQTALHVAAACRLREACEILLKNERFGMVGTCDDDGRTALHLAAHWGDVGVCELIMGHENFKIRDGQATDHVGSTALSLARECGNAEVAEAIFSRFPPGQEIPPDTESEEEQPEGEQQPDGEQS